MIEEMMKTVKRNNKRRSVNITIGTVVGFLLSCTAVMGAAIDITGDNSNFKVTSIEGNTFESNTYTNNVGIKPGPGSGGVFISGTSTENKLSFINNGTIEVKEYHGIRIDSSSEITGKIINNGIISSTAAEAISIAGKLTDTDANKGIVNNGIIDAKTSGIEIVSNAEVTGDIVSNGIIKAKTNGINVVNNAKVTGDIVSNGLIEAGTSGINIAGTLTKTGINQGRIILNNTSSGDYYGIKAEGTANKILNNGYLDIKSTETSGAGISAAEITNYGNIRTNGSTGIKITGTTETTETTGTTEMHNYGLINSKDGVGLDIANSEKVVRNFGIISGKTNAIKNDGTESNNFSNYGLIINKEVKGVTLSSSGDTNYGMTISIKGDGTYLVEGRTEHSAAGTSIVNADLIKNESGETIGTETKLSSDLEENPDTSHPNQYAINGINNTFTVDQNRNLTKSFINAYGRAVIMNDGKELIATDKTVFNGGVDGKSETVLLKGNNTLSLDGMSIINGNTKIDGNNSRFTMNASIQNGDIEVNGDSNNLSFTNGGIVNGQIEITGVGNTLNISGEDTYINGDMTAANGKNTLNLGGKSTDGNSLNMFHNVDGFNEMNITEGSVTFFEDSKVTGTDKVTVAEDATLNLRLKKTGTQTGAGLDEATHAFSNNGEMVMEGLDKGGTLKFITNGIGQGVWVDVDDMQIKNMNIDASSAIDSYYKFEEDGGLVIKAADDLDDMQKSGEKIENSNNVNLFKENIFDKENFDSINDIYKGIRSSTNAGNNLDALRNVVLFDRNSEIYNADTAKTEQLKNLQAYLNEVYTQSPYVLSSELSRKSAGMFRDIVTDNMFRPNLNQWMIMGGLTHIDGGTKDTYYGEVYEMDGRNSLGTKVDTKLTGAYALGKYGYSENVTLGVTVGGNKSEAELAKSKVKGNSGYIGVFAENYRGNLTLKAGAGVQYSEYDADRGTIGGYSYSDKYSDTAYDIYLNGRYSNPVGENLFLEPYATLSYTYVDQEGTDEGSKALAMETDSKSFDYTAAKVGVDLKKVIPHEIGKSTLSAGVSYTKLLSGADSDNLTGRFKGGNDFDILLASKNEHSLGVNAKYALELENGILFDVKGSYSFERDSHNNNTKNKNKGEWIVGAGLGYKF